MSTADRSYSGAVFSRLLSSTYESNKDFKKRKSFAQRAKFRLSGLFHARKTEGSSDPAGRRKRPFVGLFKQIISGRKRHLKARRRIRSLENVSRLSSFSVSLRPSFERIQRRPEF
ncbi:hypothetical protein ACOME3_007731 [Neoechinorhynchus agilis]